MSDENRAYYAFLKLLDSAYNSFEMEDTKYNQVLNGVLEALQRNGNIKRGIL